MFYIAFIFIKIVTTKYKLQWQVVLIITSMEHFLVLLLASYIHVFFPHNQLKSLQLSAMDSVCFLCFLMNKSNFMVARSCTTYQCITFLLM